MGLWSWFTSPKKRAVQPPATTTFHYVIWQNQCWVSRQCVLRWLKNEIEWAEMNDMPDIKFLAEFFAKQLLSLDGDTSEEVRVGG